MSRSMSTLVCVSCQVHDPYQCDCGDRLVGRSPTVPDGRSGCKPIWDLFCALCSTAMNIIILKWVLTDLMTCKPQGWHSNTACGFATMQAEV